MATHTIIMIVGIALVVAYDFTNGFHDAADMIATAISSRAMTPAIALTIVSVFTFLGPLLGSLAVADTIGNFVEIEGVAVHVAQSVTLSGILTAISYNLITWKLGLPSSSSNSLTSGLIGAGLFALGSSNINWGVSALMQGQFEGFMKVIAGMLISPLAGFIVGFLMIKILLRLLKRLSIKSRSFFVASQYVTVSWLALSHGTNDAQKGMGIIAMLLLASGVYTQFTVPTWVIILCASSITLGTMFGGWSIIKTVGFGIYKVKLIHSLADQIGSAMVIFTSSLVGAPTSTTQVVTSTLVGIGTGDRPRHVRWTMVKSILKGWLFNIPTSLVMGVIYCYILMHLLK